MAPEGTEGGARGGSGGGGGGVAVSCCSALVTSTVSLSCSSSVSVTSGPAARELVGGGEGGGCANCETLVRRRVGSRRGPGSRVSAIDSAGVGGGDEFDVILGGIVMCCR